MKNLIFQYPAWWTVVCVLLGLTYAGILYYRDQTFKDQPSYLRWLMAALRFTAVTLLSLLLLSPLLRSLLVETKKPIIVLAQDGSESVGAGMTKTQRSDYDRKVAALQNQLNSDYELHTYSFGSAVREGIDTAFNDKLTNISKLLQTVYDQFSNQNLGAIILATDGVYNEGSNPIYTSEKLAAPIYTVALGDTTPKRDLILKRAFHNRIAYLGDKFTVEMDVAAINGAGSNTNLNVYKVENNGTQLLQQLPIAIDRNDFFTTRQIVLDADKSGVQRFRLTLNPISGEVSTLNNSKEIFIDVLDAREKILILANAPHPDLTAIKQSISTNKNYQVTVSTMGEFKGNVAEFDMVILHDLPSTHYDVSGILNIIQTRKIPTFFIIGSQTAISRFNSVQSLLNIRSSGPSSNEVQARLAPTFSLFNLQDQLGNEIRAFPPLTAPFGEYATTGQGQVLFYQRIGKIDTQYPLLVLGTQNDVRTAVLCGEGLWRWRLFDYLQHDNHQFFDELLGKCIQYVSIKDDKRKFRVNLSKNIFNENEQVIFDAELYNDNYELINEPDATMIIADGQGKEYNFTFNKSGRAYNLNAGILPVGNYSFRAAVIYNGQTLSYNGQFSVQPIQLELYETTADHSTLRQLSAKYGGQMVYPDQMESIADMIKAKETVKPVRYETVQTRPVINLKWIFFILLALLSLEWFMRRYLGAY